MKFDSPVFVHSKVVILYERADHVKKSVFSLEEKFSGQFLNPELFPVPDEAPVEIPRIIFRSKHGHSSININPIKTELNTQYDNNYNADFDKCFNYIEEKTAFLKIFSDETKVNIVGVGCVVNLRWPSLDETEEVLAEKLEKRLISDVLYDGNAYDLRVNIAKVIDGRFFINTNYSNYRNFFSKTPITTPYPRLGELDLQEFGLEVVIDVNDKYGYNKGLESEGIGYIKSFLTKIKEEIDNVKKKMTGGISDAK